MTSPVSPPRRRLIGAALLSAGTLAGARAGAAPATPRTAVLTAQTTEGPYYFDPGLVRSDITENLPGVPLDVQIAVLDDSGRALPGMRVNIWHCDAQGLYSGYDGQGPDRRTSTRGRTFLRGSQFADGDGRVRFASVYPGWYEGRTTHIHFKVLHEGRAVLTSQFFLPDALSEFLYTQLPAYRRAQLRAVLNSNDGIALEAGDTVRGAVREDGERYLASLTVAVDPRAHPVIDRPPPPGEGPPPGPPPGASGGRWRAVGEGSDRVQALVPGTRKQAR